LHESKLKKAIKVDSRLKLASLIRLISIDPLFNNRSNLIPVCLAASFLPPCSRSP